MAPITVILGEIKDIQIGKEVKLSLFADSVQFSLSVVSDSL